MVLRSVETMKTLNFHAPAKRRGQPPKSSKPNGNGIKMIKPTFYFSYLTLLKTQSDSSMRCWAVTSTILFSTNRASLPSQSTPTSPNNQLSQKSSRSDIKRLIANNLCFCKPSITFDAYSTTVIQSNTVTFVVVKLLTNYIRPAISQGPILHQ